MTTTFIICDICGAEKPYDYPGMRAHKLVRDMAERDGWRVAAVSIPSGHWQDLGKDTCPVCVLKEAQDKGVQV